MIMLMLLGWEDQMKHAHKLQTRQFGISGSSRTSPGCRCTDSDSSAGLKCDQLHENRTGECWKFASFFYEFLAVS